jgi:hypothetical protein
VRRDPLAALAYDSFLLRGQCHGLGSFLRHIDFLRLRAMAQSMTRPNAKCATHLKACCVIGRTAPTGRRPQYARCVDLRVIEDRASARQTIAYVWVRIDCLLPPTRGRWSR